MNKNTQLRAFLDMLAYSEGTDNGRQPTNNHGYDVIVGGKLFYDYSKHPGVYVKLNPRLTSSAAGRYQILEKFAKHYMKQLRLPDFGPDSQDKIAIQLIKECKALDDIYAGRIHSAVYKCRSRWASLPGARYGQHEQKIEKLIAVFKEAGGVVID
jgi:muramidase (phage lysozyme)